MTGGAADGPGAFALVARSWRGGLPENRHFGVAAVAAPDGRIVARIGDPAVATFLRSAAKPFQAVAMLGAGLAAADLPAADLAIVCGSHAGRREHVERVAALLAGGGLGPQALRCGAHPPLDAEAARALEAAGERPGPLHNNCSGKHAGMLLACRRMGAPLADYPEPQHPLQRLIREEVAAWCGLAAGEVGLGTDGCGVPAFHVPLTAAARGYAALAAPAAATGIAVERAAAGRRVVAAMVAAPAMVAGPGRFTTRLIEVGRGRLVGKEGAQGLYGVAVLAPRPLGVAIKIADGTEACRSAVVLEVLRQLAVLDDEELAALAAFRRRAVRNWAGREVGEVAPEVRLEQPVV